jgi:hypothetical protein
VIAPSEKEFDFDDQIVNSKVYRKFLARAMAKGNLGNLGPSELIEGDLIDFSDDTNLKVYQSQSEEATTESATNLLEGLVISNVEKVARKEPVSCPRIILDLKASWR